MSLAFRVWSVAIAVSMALALSACDMQTPDQQPLSTPTTIAATSVLLATPQMASAEESLRGKIADIPNVFIVGARQSKSALATFLKTTPDQLDWVNPGLPDPVTPGTLVVIPPVYRASGETLSDVSKKIGLAEDLLRAANPQLGGKTVLPEGTVLAVPALYIVTEDTLLSSAAQRLATSDQALLSANPQLVVQKAITAGTLLVVPPGKESR